MGWFVLGILTTLGAEVFFVFGLLLIFGGSNAKGKCVSFKYYGVGTNSCIQGATKIDEIKQIPEPAHIHSCSNYKSVVE